MRVCKSGNSLAVRLPATVVDALGLKAGDNIEFVACGPRRVAVAKTQNVDEALARLRRLRGRLPAEFKFDRNEASRRTK